jgi:hypothetical protein
MSINLEELESGLLKAVMVAANTYFESQQAPPAVQIGVLSTVSKRLLAEQLAYISVMSQGGDREAVVKTILDDVVVLTRYYSQKLKEKINGEAIHT